jgi:hypothetical protein
MGEKDDVVQEAQGSDVPPVESATDGNDFVNRNGQAKDVIKNECTIPHGFHKGRMGHLRPDYCSGPMRYRR